MNNLHKPATITDLNIPNSIKSSSKIVESSQKYVLKPKICGITDENSLKYADYYGADFIGFINVKRSPRFQSMNKIKYLAGLLNNPEKAVLVLEPENAEEAFTKIKKFGIKNIQLHSLDLDNLGALKKLIHQEFNNGVSKNNHGDNNSTNKKHPYINIIRAVGLNDNINPAKKEEIKSFSKKCDGILFDYHFKGITGGTGKQIPLKIAIEAVEIAKSTNINIKIFLAGGMDYNQIKIEGKTISKYFDVVDFNSSLEDSPGIKNENKI
ncbi:MAG: phosphoribosylanthranilate isomerase, partial [Methanobacteriaceae archaeon]|nr:phosphoribosylanthranilate isomerase [Methanobacteriaceae archaeon]